MEGKKRIIKKYELLTPEELSMVQQAYPDGFEDKLISFQSPKGSLELALPLETEDIAYLIKMPKDELSGSDEEDNTMVNSELTNFETLDAAENIADD